MLDLAEQLSEWIQVSVVAPGTVTDIVEQANGLRVYRFRAPPKPLSALRPWHPVDAVAIVRVMRGGLRSTRQAVADVQPARIIALWGLPSGEWARRVSLETGIPYSVWTLGSDIWTLGRLPLVRHWLRRVLSEADACYSDGLALAEETRAIAQRHVEFLPSTRRISSTTSSLPRSGPPYRLLFLGRWHPNKGVDLLLGALERLGADDWQRIEAVEICGGGPMKDLVHDAVARLRLNGRPVELCGYLDKIAAGHALERADWVLIPSRIESIPVVFSDAMKVGRPVITMPVGDLTSLAARGGGITAGEVSVQGYVGALRRALGTSTTVFSLGISKLAEQFSLAGTARRLLAGSGHQPLP